MKRNRIPFLALITILCGLFFLTACKKGPLSLDQQEELMTDVRGISCFVIKFGKAGEQLAAKLWEEGKMVYASSANPSGKGNRGKVEGIGERIENAVDLVIEADDYVASIQPDKTIKTRYEQGVMVSMVDKDGKLILEQGGNVPSHQHQWSSAKALIFTKS